MALHSEYGNKHRIPHCGLSIMFKQLPTPELKRDNLKSRKERKIYHSNKTGNITLWRPPMVSKCVRPPNDVTVWCTQKCISRIKR